MRSIRFLARHELAPWFEGKSVAIVGSGPGVLDNMPGFIDSHDVVVRVNNYGIRGENTGKRCDVFYSFFGSSIRKTTDELKTDGVKLCMCKCPNAHAFESEWHRRKNKLLGIDYRYIYENRGNWWFCDTYIPAAEEFLDLFNKLDRHIPTTGFAAIVNILSHRPKSLYLTGFDGFRSKIHNVDETWNEKNLDDPHRHDGERELRWLHKNRDHFPMAFDHNLEAALCVATMVA